MAKDPGIAGLTFSSYQNTTNPRQNVVSVAGGASNSAAATQYYLKDAQYAYMGPKEVNGKVVPNTEVLAPVSQAANSYFFLANDKKAVLFDKMDKWYGKGRWDPSWIPKFYARAVNASAYAYSNMGAKITPLNAFDQILAGAGGSGPGGAGSGGGRGGGGGGSSMSVVTSTSTSLTDPGSARKLVDDALSNYLGRKATSKEQANFLKALNIQEQQNPTITRQVSKTAGAGGVSNTTQQVTSQGGFNPSTFAEEWAASQEGAGEYQAATTLLDAFIGSLGARI